MKKYLLVSMAIFSMTIASSQTEKGKKYIGGQFNINGSSLHLFSDANDSYDSSSFRCQIIPTFGYFIRDNFAIGVNFNFGVSNAKELTIIPSQNPSVNTIKSNSVSYGGGGFARYYKKITENFLFSLNAGASFTYQTNRYVDEGYSPSDPYIEKWQITSIYVGISPGFVYFVSPKLGIETTYSSIYYNNSRFKVIDVSENVQMNRNSYGFNLSNTTFYLGLHYYF